MAIVTAHITWNPIVGATGYLIQYKEQSSDTWITPTTPPNPTLNLSYDIDINTDTYYDGRIVTQCSKGGKTIYFTMFNEVVSYIWVEDTYTCEQDDIFTLVTTVSGLSSPQGLLYYQPNDRFYVLDADDVNGNFWWFNPSTFSSAAGRNYIAGQPVFSPSNIKTPAIDKARNRLLGAGDTTSGLVVYDIPNNTFTTVPYGTNNDGGFTRQSISIIGDNYYCGDNVANTIVVINANSLTVSNTISIGSIPSGGAFFNQSYKMTLVEGNIWVSCNSRNNVANAQNIGVYNTDLTNLQATVTIPGATTWDNGDYWQTHFYDQANDRWYAHDIGSNTLHVFNTLTQSSVHTHTFTNRQGKSNTNVGFTLNSVTNELYMNYDALNNVNDATPIRRVYKINRTTYEFENMYVNVSASNLVNRTATNEFWAVVPGLFQWNVPNTGWDTDGQAFKYTI